MEAVIFDLDGTLLNRNLSLVDFVTWQVEGMLKEQVSEKDKFIQRFLELDANGLVWKDKVYTQLIDEFSILDWSVNELLASYELCFCAFCQPMEGARKLVEAVTEMGIKVGLLSNGKSPFQERNFEALGISKYFDAVIVSEAVRLRKPQKEIFLLACNMLGVKPENTIFVGDNPESDINGANNAGMYSVLLSESKEQPCRSANAICTKLMELPDIIKAAKNA